MSALILGLELHHGARLLTPLAFPRDASNGRFHDHAARVLCRMWLVVTHHRGGRARMMHFVAAMEASRVLG